MRIAVSLGAALATGVLLTGCAAPSLPAERPVPSEMCGIDTNTTSTQPEVLDLTLYSCGTVPEWLAGLEAAGEETSMEFLADTCSGQDTAPICADAIERELIEPSGNAELGRLSAAAEWCGVAEGVADEGASLSVVAKGMDAVVTPECLLAKLQAPSYVSEHLGSTRALDGQQTDEWMGLEARWTYHPDSGTNLTVVDRTKSAE